MTSALLIGFCNVHLAFGDHLVLGKLSFEIGAARLSMSLVPSDAAKPQRCASPPAHRAARSRGSARVGREEPPLLP